MYTTDDLIKSVRIRGMLPDVSQGSLSSENMLILASEELLANIVPMILSVREHYYETFLDQPMVGGVQYYPIPQRSIGQTLALVQYLLQGSIAALNPIDPVSLVATVPTLYPKAFYYQGGGIMLDDVPSVTQGILRMRYFQRPSLLIESVNCGKIIAVGTNTVTLSNVPSTWAAGTQVDFVPGTLPYTPYGLQTPVTGVTGNVVSFASLPLNYLGNTNPTIGDWIAPENHTPIPEVPNEFFTLLAQATIVKLLEASGAEEHLATATGMLKTYADNAVRLISPRDQWGLKKVCSNWRNR